MAKGQARSGREPKKPKATKKPAVESTVSQFQTPPRANPTKSGGGKS